MSTSIQTLSSKAPQSCVCITECMAQQTGVGISAFRVHQWAVLQYYSSAAVFTVERYQAMPNNNVLDYTVVINSVQLVLSPALCCALLLLSCSLFLSQGWECASSVASLFDYWRTGWAPSSQLRLILFLLLPDKVLEQTKTDLYGVLWTYRLLDWGEWEAQLVGGTE